MEGAEGDTIEKRAVGSTLPLTPTKYTERLVGRTEPRVKGERKGLFCAFHPSGAHRHENAHSCSLINTC